MRHFQPLIVASFGLFMIAHSLFPPRFAETSIENRHTRGFVFSEDFNKVDHVDSVLTDEQRNRGILAASRFNNASFDWTRYTVILASVAGLSLVLLAGASVLQKQ